MQKKLVYSSYLDCYGTMLTEKQRDVLSLYYNEDYSLSEISDILGISRQGVMDLIRRGETQLDSFEQHLMLTTHYKKLSTATAMLESLKADVDSGLEKRIEEIVLLLRGE